MNEKRQTVNAKMKERARSLTIGVEIECVGVRPSYLASAVCNKLNASAPGVWTITQARDRYGRLCEAIAMADQRAWVFTRDGSLPGGGCEIVSPILTWNDIPTLQAIARAARECGARADEHCGVHVHIGADQFNRHAFQALVAQVGRKEELIRKALRIHNSRASYAQPMDRHMRESFRTVPISRYGAADTWAGRIASTCGRYVGVNLTSLNERPTVEFRWFNGTLHAGRIKAYVQLCAHLAASALETKQVVWKSRTIAAPRYDMKAMATMLRAFAIDPKDEEYATAFDVLTRAFRTRVTARQEPEA